MAPQSGGNIYSSIAQSVEHSAVNRSVVGSSPTWGVIWLHGQAVKTSPFHGGNTGSIPVGVIRFEITGFGPLAQLVRAPPCHGGGHGFESRLGRLSVIIIS